MSAEGSEWLNAAQASAFLSVRKQTLYAYASRGQVRVRRQGNLTVYARADLEALRARSQARRGHAAVAAGALRFGEPVLDTRVSSIQASGPRYRGHSALELAERGVSAELVAELLWTGELRDQIPAWPRTSVHEFWPRTIVHHGASRERSRHDLAPTSCMLLTLANVTSEPDGWQRAPSDELASARRLVRALAAAPALALGKAALDRALRSNSLARALLTSLAARTTPAAERAVNQALVLIADHELNASTFVARVAASAGADLARALSAALATLSGTRHGGVCDRLERVLDGFTRPEQAIAWIRKQLEERKALPGFGHPLYPEGDPRAEPLLRTSFALGKGRLRLRAIEVMIEAMALAGGEAPTVDLALVAVSAALGLRGGGAAAMFALGRALGYVAHVLEQREQGFLLRPRAHYVGV